MLTLLLALLACAPADPGEDRFEVVSSLPADGDDAVSPGVRPELRLDAPAEPLACTPAELGLVALAQGAIVAFEVPLSIELLDGGNKISLVPDEELPSGLSYAYVVRSGGEACLDVDGRPLQPFHAGFFVP